MKRNTTSVNTPDDVTPAEVVASVIMKQGNIERMAITRAIGYRCPVSTLAKIDAFAAYSGKSRAWVVTSVLDVGLRAVYAELSEEVEQELQVLESGVLAELVSGENEQISE